VNGAISRRRFKTVCQNRIDKPYFSVTETGGRAIFHTFDISDEQADALLFLSSEQAIYITGHVLRGDGGRTRRL
jgi:NAD(P)-dependent dehydrogenase (short-subunit alcohol dehydrogenase family)